MAIIPPNKQFLYKNTEWNLTQKTSIVQYEFPKFPHYLPTTNVSMINHSKTYRDVVMSHSKPVDDLE